MKKLSKITNISDKTIGGVATLLISGLAGVTVITSAILFSLAITGAAALIIGINTLDGIKGKEIRKALKEDNVHE